MKNTTTSKSPAQNIAEGLFSTGAFLLFAAIVIFVFMCLHWIKFGDWPDWSPTLLGCEPPETSLVGLNRIIAWFYDLQCATLVAIGGAATFYVGMKIGEIRETKAD